MQPSQESRSGHSAEIRCEYKPTSLTQKLSPIDLVFTNRVSLSKQNPLKYQAWCSVVDADNTYELNSSFGGLVSLM